MLASLAECTPPPPKKREGSASLNPRCNGPGRQGWRMRRNARKPLPEDERLASREMPHGMPVAMIMGAWRCCEACGAGNGPGRRKSATPHPRRTRQVHNSAGNHADAASRHALLWGPTIHPGWLLKCRGTQRGMAEAGPPGRCAPHPKPQLGQPTSCRTDSKLERGHSQ